MVGKVGGGGGGGVMVVAAVVVLESCFCQRRKTHMKGFSRDVEV